MITIDARWINTSGIGTYLRQIIPGIVDRFSKYEITLLGEPDELLTMLGGIPDNCVFVTSRAKMYSIREQFDYLRLIPRNTTLYFSTHYNIPLFYTGLMLVTVYDLMHVAMPQFVVGYHKRFYAKIMFAAVRRKADTILTISEFTKCELRRLVGDFSQPVMPILLGVDDVWYSIPAQRSPHSRPYFLYVGNIKPHKNLSVLVKAFSLIANDIEHDLILVGKKEGFITGDQEVFHMARKLGDRVRFTGRVTDDQLRQYFHHADAFVFPSLYEGFGLPPLEAMAAGCPVLVSTAGSLQEVCGDAALYFNPLKIEDLAEKLLMLVSDSDLCDSLIKRGLERARLFKWESCVRQTCDVIHNILPICKESTS